MPCSTSIKSTGLKVWTHEDWGKFMCVSAGRILGGSEDLCREGWPGPREGKVTEVCRESDWGRCQWEQGRTGRGWTAWVEARTVRVGVSKGEGACVFPGKELPGRQERSRQLNGLNNVLLNADTRSTSALRVQHGIRPPVCRIMQPSVCSDCKILRQFHRVWTEKTYWVQGHGFKLAVPYQRINQKAVSHLALLA